jgi:hypothetical protein
MIENYDLTPPKEEAADPEQVAYPTNIFPEIMQQMQSECCRIFGVNPDLPGPLLIAAISNALGAKFMLEDRGRRTGSDAFFFSTAQSGTGKSSVFREIYGPLKTIQAEGIQKHRDLTLPRVRAERLELESERDKIKREFSKGDLDEGDEDTRRNRLIEIEVKLDDLRRLERPPTLYVEDVTSQALPGILESQGFATLASPDAGDVIANFLGRYNDGKSDVNLLLKAAQREGSSTDRIGRDRIELEEVIMSMSLVGTPDLATQLYANQRLKTGGFLPRILLTNSKSKPARDEGQRLTVRGDISERWESALKELVSSFYNSDETLLVETSAAASEAFREAYNARLQEIETGIAPAFTSRIVEQAKRLALNLHAAKYLSKAPNVELPEATAQAGLALSEFHYRQALAMLRDSEFEADSRLYDRLKKNASKAEQLTVSQARNLHGIDAEELRAKRPGWLKITEKKTGGRPAKVIEFHR